MNCLSCRHVVYTLYVTSCFSCLHIICCIDLRASSTTSHSFGRKIALCQLLAASRKRCRSRRPWQRWLPCWTMANFLGVSIFMLWSWVLSNQIRCRGQILGWTGLIRVDGTSYTWMGAPTPLPTVVTQTSFEYTSTRSTFIMAIGGLVTMNVTFLSPLTPTDMVRQSLPFSYLDVTISSSDGSTHDVQLYTDITAGNFTHQNSNVRAIF